MQRTGMSVPGSGILGGLGMGRNIQGLLIAKGGTVEEIKETMPELAEGPGLHYIIKFAGII